MAGGAAETTLDGEELRRLIQAGQVRADTLVKPPGADAWVMACEVPELQAAFASRTAGAPPPIPARPPSARPSARTNGAAVMSLVLGLLGLCTFGLSAVAGLVVGLVGLRQIRRSEGRQRGNGWAVAGLGVSAVTVCLLPVALGLAIPAALKAHKKSQAALCVRHLRELDAAKERWAVDQQKAPGDVPLWSDLVGPYLPKQLTCPRGGTYTLSAVAERPQCSIPEHTMYPRTRHRPR